MVVGCGLCSVFTWVCVDLFGCGVSCLADWFWYLLIWLF